MNKKLILLAPILFLKIHAYGQVKEKPKLMVDNEIVTNIDSVKSGQSILKSVKVAVQFTESYIMDKIGKENFHNNYKFDSIFSEVFWVSVEDGKYTRYSKALKNSDRYFLPIEEYAKNLRLVYHYNFAFESIKSHTKGFSIHVQLAGDRSAIEVQGLVKLTKERSLNNILAREELLQKIQNHKFRKDVRKSIKKNITVNQIVYDQSSVRGELFCEIYYSILLLDIKEPAYYKFDPWTGEFSKVIKVKFN